MLPVLPPGTVIYGWRWFMRLKARRVIVFVRQQKEIVKRIDHIEPQGLFVLGDHPDGSTDSRQYGVIPRESVEAVVFWPRTRKVVAQTAEVDVTRPTDIEA